MAGRPGKIPFYTTVTPVNEKFTDENGKAQSYDLPLVTLPAGTILFRGVKIPDTSAGQDIRYFYRDFLGSPEADGTVCMSPVHNVFFYPFPHVFYGTHTIGATFNMVEIVVLVHPVNLVCATSPSTWVRGQGQRYSGTAPWQRCSSFEGPDVDCHPATAQESEAKRYDNCLLPEYQVRSGTRGWMAIADLDSINPKKKKWNSDKPVAMKDSTMGAYLRGLHSRAPEEAIDLLLKTYKDDHQHAGYPEIALYPYKTHQGRRLLTRPCKTENDAIQIMEEEANADNLNYLPLALITNDGVVDMVNGHFTYSRTGVTYNTTKNSTLFNPAVARPSIEQATREYMKTLQEQGMTLPFYGKSKMSFDSRTGFYVFPSIVPANLTINIPKAILYKNLNIATPSDANKPAYENERYRTFCMALESAEDKRRVHIYEIMFRSFLPEHFLEKYGLDAGYGRRRAFIFEKYPFLDTLFKELGIPLPKDLTQTLGRAGALYRKEIGKQKRAKPITALNSRGAAAASAVAMNLSPVGGTVGGTAAGTAAGTGVESPMYDPNAQGAITPRTPLYREITPRTPEFGGMTPRTPEFGEITPRTPEFGGMTPRTPEFGDEGLAAVPAAAARTPPFPPQPPAAVGGARRKTRGKSAKKRRKTRKTKKVKSNDNINSHAMRFASIWKAHTTVKHNANV
jgi:hypothetical protein